MTHQQMIVINRKIRKMVIMNKKSLEKDNFEKGNLKNDISENDKSEKGQF